jgi:hypothetical protein
MDDLTLRIRKGMMAWEDGMKGGFSSEALFWMFEYPEDSLSHFLQRFLKDTSLFLADSLI